MRVIASTSRFNLSTVRQIVGLKRMWFFTFRKELDVSKGLTQSDVRELILKIYNYEESRYGKYYGSI
ncbi:hypothetical protein CDB3_29880 [Bacillus sp. CDB3]|nr:hypothetical protein CDB3_29880 [Bacillus sp. CDB3]